MAVTFDLPAELHARIREIAASERRSLSQTLIIAVEEYVHRRDHASRVDEIAGRVVAEDEELLRRLA